MLGQVEVVVDQAQVKRRGRFQLLLGLGDALFERGLVFRATSAEPVFQHEQRGGHDEDGQRAVAEDGLEGLASHHVHVKQRGPAVAPQALHLAAQRAVRQALVHLLVLDECAVFHLRGEVRGIQKW